MAVKKKKEQFQTSDIKFQIKNGKNDLPDFLFHKVWLIIADCKYNYIAEFKIVNSYSLAFL